MSEFPELEYFGSWMREHKHPDPFGYPKGAVDDWFKRCLKNFPHYRGFSLEAHKDDVKEWHVKWFSQFVHNSEEEVDV